MQKITIILLSCFHKFKFLLDPECSGYTVAECGLRQEKCKPINSLMMGTGGPVKPVLDCATAVGIPKTAIFTVLRKYYFIFAYYYLD